MTTPTYFGDLDDDDQKTLNTIADYVADARTLLQDLVVPYRYLDAELVTAMNVTLLEARRLRPDLFVFFNNGMVQNFSKVDDTQVVMEQPFRLAMLHGMIGHALERDQEDYQDDRATAFLGIFNDMLLGMRVRPIVGGSGPGRPGR